LGLGIATSDVYAKDSPMFEVNAVHDFYLQHIAND